MSFRQLNGDRLVFSTNDAKTNEHSHAKNKEPNLALYTKINPTWITAPNVKPIKIF